MLPECPDELKHILPYLQRAAELKSREPVIAYYCGFYAANLALGKGYTKTPENDHFLMTLVNELEQEKKELVHEPAIAERDQARSLILQFAMRIFLAADNEDRSGQATKKTGRLFLIASQFLEVARVVGELGDEIEERVKYAKWKAADIIRSINEGRQPLPGPPGSHNENDTIINSNEAPQQEHSSSLPPATVPPGSPLESSNLPSLSGNFPTNKPITPPLSPQQNTSNAPPPVMAPPMISPTPSQEVRRNSPPIDVMISMANAEKLARFGVSAIQFEDIPTAIKNLETALKVLYGLQNKSPQS